MDKILAKIRELVARPLVTGILGFTIGLIIGLPLLGWKVWPVKWTDAAPYHMRKDAQQEYLRMAIESYAYDQDARQGLLRWKELGDGASQLLMDIQSDTRLKPEDISNFSVLVQVPLASGSTAIVTPEQTAESGLAGLLQTPSAGSVTPTATAKQGSAFNPIFLLVLLCLLALAVLGALFYVLVIRKKSGGLLKTSRQTEAASSQEKTAYYQEGQEAPIAQFMTSYQLGDDLYDDSFSIDSPSGEFLGECGVGISETIGVGDPKKVTAFEVWLFDKNDIQTITKVMMSEHAFNDPTISQRLVSKGEPMVIEAGKQIVLETASLQLEARIVDMNYGKGALPDGSFFDRLTLELSVWPKAAQ